jgi:RNA polymerase sigma factor (sigma-70 family)
MNQPTEPLQTIPAQEWDALIGNIVKRFTPFCYMESTVDRDDLVQEAWVALLRACANFKPELAGNCKFTTYAYTYINGSLCRLVGKRKQTVDTVGLDPDHTNIPMKLEDTIERDDLRKKIFGLVEDEEYVELIHKHFIDGKSYRELAKEYGCSHNSINIRIQKLLAVLNHRLQNENR